MTEPVAKPDLTTPAQHGAYLVTMRSCNDCHTPRNPKFQLIPGMELAGGTPIAAGVASANLTPDASGIGYYNEAPFIQAMRTGYVRARKLNSIVPWWVFRNMTDDDLEAVFAYLRTLKPVHHLDRGLRVGLGSLGRAIGKDALFKALGAATVANMAGIIDPGRDLRGKGF